MIGPLPDDIEYMRKFSRRWIFWTVCLYLPAAFLIGWASLESGQSVFSAVCSGLIFPALFSIALWIPAFAIFSTIREFRE